jgi:large-conductance mechanosensitive channel
MYDQAEHRSRSLPAVRDKITPRSAPDVSGRPTGGAVAPDGTYRDDTPKALWGELQSSIVRTSIGRIALAVVLAQAVLNFIRTFVWNLLMPIVANLLHHQSESVLFERYRNEPIRWDYLFNSLLQLVLAVIFVLFVNRWIRPRPPTSNAEGDVSEEHTSDEQSAMSKEAGR